jgi:hypothetical protein
MGSVPMQGRPKHAALAAALCLAGVLIVVWLLSRRTAPAVAAPAPVGPTLEQPDSAHVPETDLRGPAKQLSPFPPWKTAALWTAPVQNFGSQPSPSGPLAPGTLSGRVVAYGPDGGLLPPSSGAMELTFWGSFGSSEEVGFAEGRWSLNAEGRTWERLEITRVRIGEQYAAIESPREIFGWPPNGKLDVTVTLPRVSTLRVIDVQSGVELDGIEIVRAREFPLSHVLHPGASRDGRVLVRGARSPVELPQSLFGQPPPRNAMELRIGADGYAWAEASLDVYRGGERAMGLRRAGTLEVTLLGGSPDQQAELRLRGVEDYPLLAAEPAPRAGTVRIAGLCPGHLRVSVEVGPHWRDPVVLGSAEAELAAGATTAVTIALDPMPSPERAEASGWILVPTAWELDRMRAHLEPLGPSLDSETGWFDIACDRVPSPRAGYTAFRWSRPGLPLGRYELSLFEPPGSMVFDVVPGGVRDVLFVLPQPVELLVRLVEAGTAVDIRTDDLRWHPRMPDEVKGWALQGMEFDAETGLYRSLAPAAPILLQCWTVAYESFQREYDLALVTGVVTVELRPASGLAVALRDGDAPVAFPEAWWSRPVAEGGDGSEAGLTSGDKFLRQFQVSAPGTYVLELPAIDGYQAPPPLRVDVRAGEFTRVDVELRRAIGG